MDTPIEEQQMFQNVTCNIAASEHEITEPNTLSVDFINYVSYRHFNRLIVIICFSFLGLSIRKKKKKKWMVLFQDL